MSYINKNGNIVISARMTDKGREMLSIGKLNFNTFKLGDSEIDYSSLGSNQDITLQNILRAKAVQPKAKTWLLNTPEEPEGTVVIPPLTPLEVGTILEPTERGVFEPNPSSGISSIVIGGGGSLNVGEIISSNLDGTNTTTINSNGDTISGVEPSQGDFVVVKMVNPELTSPSNNFVDSEQPTQYLTFKIQSLSGDLSSGLVVDLDRDLPNFSNYSGDTVCDVVFYPNSGNGLDFSEGQFSGGTVWNMNNVWSDNMAGVDLSNYEGFNYYGSESYVGSKEFFGYTSGVVDPCNIKKAVSIIHFSNSETCDKQSELIYGQKMYVELDLDETPTLKLPTVMWHKSVDGKMGLELKASGVLKKLNQGTRITDIEYYDLSDEQGFVVGKVFIDQQIFVIDDDELVAAMSYKSNRNWTLPKVNLGLKTSNDGLVDNTEDLYVTYLFNNTGDGFKPSLHSQYHSCIKVDEVVDEDGNVCGDGQTKDVEVTFPSNSLPFMNTQGGEGWYSDQLIMLVQKVPEGTEPSPYGWYSIDVTSEINNGLHTVGDRIEPIDLLNTTFTLKKNVYDNAVLSNSLYNIHDYINIPTIPEIDLLQFGDESLFFGNVESKGITNKYRTKFNFVVPPNNWNTTNNPTWLGVGGGENPHISEVIIQDKDGNVVAVGKENLPIEKTPNTTIIIEIAFDV